MQDIEEELRTASDDGNIIVYHYGDFTIAYHRDSRSMKFRKQNTGTLIRSDAMDIPPLDVIEHIYGRNIANH